MAGHSKWAQIKRQKGVADSRRSAVFTKLGAAITSAARGGADPAMNFKLRLAIDKARQANMPNDNIERAVQRASGIGGAAVEEITYEVYGPGGTALMVAVLTDNRNRAANELRGVLNKRGGTLAATGSVTWMFSTKGLVRIARERLGGVSIDDLTLALIDAGAEDVHDEPEGLTITCPPPMLEAVQMVCTARQLAPDDASIESIPSNTVTLSSADQSTLDTLVTELEAIEDVQSVVTNAHGN